MFPIFCNTIDIIIKCVNFYLVKKLLQKILDLSKDGYFIACFVLGFFSLVLFGIFLIRQVVDASLLEQKYNRTITLQNRQLENMKKKTVPIENSEHSSSQCSHIFGDNLILDIETCHLSSITNTPNAGISFDLSNDFAYKFSVKYFTQQDLFVITQAPNDVFSYLNLTTVNSDKTLEDYVSSFTSEESSKIFDYSIKDVNRSSDIEYKTIADKEVALVSLYLTNVQGIKHSGEYIYIIKNPDFDSFWLVSTTVSDYGEFIESSIIPSLSSSTYNKTPPVNKLHYSDSCLNEGATRFTKNDQEFCKFSTNMFNVTLPLNSFDAFEGKYLNHLSTSLTLHESSAPIDVRNITERLITENKVGDEISLHVYDMEDHPLPLWESKVDIDYLSIDAKEVAKILITESVETPPTYPNQIVYVVKDTSQPLKYWTLYFTPRTYLPSALLYTYTQDLIEEIIIPSLEVVYE